MGNRNLRRCLQGGAAAVLLLAGLPAGGETITYTYDEFGQLKSATSSSGPAVTYTYDAAGNRTQLTVPGSNQSPDAVDDSISVGLDTPNTFDPRVNDSDPDSNPLTITAKTDGSYGTVGINSGVSLTYTPDTSYTGPDSFTYTISDGHGGQDTATVTVDVIDGVVDGTVLYTSSTSGSFSYTIPAGVEYVDIEGWGGGANAGYWSAYGVYVGGGGGGYFKKHVAVTENDEISGNIAAGGGSSATTVSSLSLTANTPAAVTASGGTATGGDINTQGSTCCQVALKDGGGAGNGGGAQTTQNANGTTPGGGGAGNYGQGANGRITITARTS